MQHATPNRNSLHDGDRGTLTTGTCLFSSSLLLRVRLLIAATQHIWHKISVKRAKGHTQEETLHQWNINLQEYHYHPCTVCPFRVVRGAANPNDMALYGPLSKKQWPRPACTSEVCIVLYHSRSKLFHISWINLRTFRSHERELHTEAYAHENKTSRMWLKSSCSWPHFSKTCAFCFLRPTSFSRDECYSTSL